MKFGEYVFSRNFSKSVNFQRIERESLTVYEIKKATFLYLRPDNGKAILEIGDRLVQEKPKDIYILNEKNGTLFLKELSDYYDERIQQFDEKIQNILSDKKQIKIKMKHLVNEIHILEEKLKEEHTENRLKSQNQLKKALRKLERQILSLDSKLSEENSNKEKMQKGKDYSIKLFKKEFKF